MEWGKKKQFGTDSSLKTSNRKKKRGGCKKRSLSHQGGAGSKWNKGPVRSRSCRTNMREPLEKSRGNDKKKIMRRTTHKRVTYDNATKVLIRSKHCEGKGTYRKRTMKKNWKKK